MDAYQPGQPEHPDVLLRWLMEAAQDNEWRSSSHTLTKLVVATNFASIDTTSIVSDSPTAGPCVVLSHNSDLRLSPTHYLTWPYIQSIWRHFGKKSRV